MSALKHLHENLGRLRTRMGAVFPGVRAVFRGHDLHNELRDMDWLELFVFGITGRRFTPAQIKLIHALWTYTSYPDARIWNNRVMALAGNARSTPPLGVAAALAVSEARIYGGAPLVHAIEFLRRAQTRVAAGEKIEDIVQQERAQRRILGYGRPIESVDERLPWLMKLAAELSLDGGPHVKVAFEVERVLLLHHPRLKMTYAALAAAFAADLGFTVEEFHHFQVPIFLAGMPPCFIEAAQRPEGTSFALSCAQIEYEGVARRPWRHTKKNQTDQTQQFHAE
jgi:hypothetical protein